MSKQLHSIQGYNQNDLFGGSKIFLKKKKTKNKNLRGKKLILKDIFKKNNKKFGDQKLKNLGITVWLGGWAQAKGWFRLDSISILPQKSFYSRTPHSWNFLNYMTI